MQFGSTLLLSITLAGGGPLTATRPENALRARQQVQSSRMARVTIDPRS